MIYPIDYTEDDKIKYNYVSNRKGEEYILTVEEQEQMSNIWKTYGEPNINYIYQ